MTTMTATVGPAISSPVVVGSYSWTLVGTPAVTSPMEMPMMMRKSLASTNFVTALLDGAI